MSNDKLSDQERTIKNQEICKRLVEREVIHCCSTMMYEMRDKLDDYLEMHAKLDYESALRESDEVELYEDEYGVLCGRDEDGNTWAIGDDWQEACDFFGVEPYEHEVYEHWIVTSWFAKNLEDQGEVVFELFDFHIWGRCCTGQAIAMDSVIESIASDMEILCGMRNDWSK